jgi:hypothetical protein
LTLLLLPLLARPPLDGLFCLKRLRHAFSPASTESTSPVASKQQAICSLMECGTGTFPARHCSIQCAVVRIFCLRQNHIRYSLPRVQALRACRQNQSASAAGSAAGWHTPRLPCRASVTPVRQFLKELPTRATYSGCDTLERRRAASSPNGVASFASVCALLRTPIRQRISSCFSSGGQSADRDINRLMAIQLRLRLAGMQGWFDAQHPENGLRQHAGWIFADAVHHHREPQLV